MLIFGILELIVDFVKGFFTFRLKGTRGLLRICVFFYFFKGSNIAVRERGIFHLDHHLAF